MFDNLVGNLPGLQFLGNTLKNSPGMKLIQESPGKKLLQASPVMQLFNESPGAKLLSETPGMKLFNEIFDNKATNSGLNRNDSEKEKGSNTIAINVVTRV